MPGVWTSRSGKTLAQMIDGAPADFPKNAPNAVAFRPKLPPARPNVMRGMQRLSHLTTTAIVDMDKKADAVADRIANGQARADIVIQKFGALADSIEATAAEVEAALGQISNDPTQASGA